MTPDPAAAVAVAEDMRAGVFCSTSSSDLFHAFAYSNDVWKADPFDVESIHENVRGWFNRTIDRVLTPSGLPSGRMLLLLGESGSGKTHLMRAFRSRVHGQERGYFAYMQMTAFAGEYGRYVLNNLVESLDRPYDESRSPESGLTRLSRKLAESLGEAHRDDLDRLREGGLDQSALDEVVSASADALIVDERFRDVDVYLLQALLYLQGGDPRIKARVLKYLRCEDLNDHDRRLLGGIVPCTYADAPHWVIERIGKLIWALEKVPLIICVDQLEDVFDLDEAAVKFRKAMAVLCDVVSRLPSAVVVISCLENFYDELKRLLTRSTKDRIENDPRPVSLQTPCDLQDVRALIGRRLQYLYETSGARYQADEPTFPLPDVLVSRLVGLRARDVLLECQAYRDRCVQEGKMAAYPFEGTGDDHGPSAVDVERAVNQIEQAWNAFRSDRAAVVPVGEAELADVLAAAIREAPAEVPALGPMQSQADGRFVAVETPSMKLIVGVCNKAPQGGALARQIAELTSLASGRKAVAVRSSGFPGNPRLVVYKVLATFDQGGGGRVVVEDSDWRTMTAFAAFRGQHEAQPAFEPWRKRTRPLTSLKSLRTILDLDSPGPVPPPPPEEDQDHAP